MIRFCVDHPVATWMLFTALVITGIYALPRLEIEAMPETELPSLSIDTAWNGASPAAIQRSITIPIEEAARQVHGVEEITARSRPGRSTVTVSFRRDVDMEFAQLDLAEQLGSVRRNLPATANPPQIVPYVPEEFRTGDFLTISLISPLSANELRDRAESWLVSRMLAIPGVADVELQGGARPLLRVLLDFQMMERYQITSDRIFNQLQALDDILPAGSVRRLGQDIAISVQDSVTVDRLRKTIVANVGGQTLTLDRLATLEPSYEDPYYFVRINGDNVIQASVAKRSGTNAVSVSRRIRATLPEIREAMPFPVEFDIDTDQGKELEDKLIELVIRSGIILLILFVLLALALQRIRLTGIVIGSILLAIVICLSLFYFFGISVNFITISGLTVCFGMLLDNSILVLDAIHRRFVTRKHDDPRRALISGTSEVAFPITATTLTTVVAFLSFIFLSGRLALYYVPLAVSVGIAMLASIFVAFGWIPVALRGTAEREMAIPAETARAEAEPEGWALLWRWSLAAVLVSLAAIPAMAVINGWEGRWCNPLSALGRGWSEAMDLWRWLGGASVLLILVGIFASWVRKFTSLHLRFWWFPIAVLVAACWGGLHLYQNEISHGGFFRMRDPEVLICYIERPVGTDVILASETMRQFEAELTPIPDGITMKTTSFDNRAFMEVRFEEDMLRTEYPEMFRNRMIVLAEELGGMFIFINGFGDPYMKGGRGGGMSNSLIRITGYNSKELTRISEETMDRLSRNRRVRNVRLTGGDRFDRSNTDETLIVIDREAIASYHISVMEVVGYLRRLLGIEFPWHMLVDGEDQRLQLSFANADDIQYDQIAAHVMTTQAGNQVRLSDLVELVQQPVISSINRKDQRYSMQINWEYVGTDKMRQRYIQDILAGIELPYGYTAEDVSGEQLTEEEEEEMNQMLLLTAVFIFMALAALFESLTLPLLVLLSLPMAMCGVMALFWLTDSTFDSSAKIGLVLLFGIVVNNAILLINRYRLQLREKLEDLHAWRDQLPGHARIGGVDIWRLPPDLRRTLLHDAICDGTRIQLRSILLTSGTTIAGMLPLLIQLSDEIGKDIWENLALSSVGGLASSTVLIISAIPALYWAFTRLGWALAETWQRFRPILIGALCIAAINLGAVYGGLKLNALVNRHYLFFRQGDTPLPADFAVLITLLVGWLWLRLASRDGRTLRLHSGWDLAAVWLLAIPIGQVLFKLLGWLPFDGLETILTPRGLLFFQLLVNALLMLISARMVHRAARRRPRR